MEKTGLDLPMSDLLMVKVVEQSEGSDSRGSIRRTRLVWPGDTRHRHSDSVYGNMVKKNTDSVIS